MRYMILIAICFTLISASPGTAAPYYPLETGWLWTFVRNDGATIDYEIVGQTTILGREVFIRRRLDYQWEEYVSETPDGDVLWHGASGVGSAVYLDPPVVTLKGGAQPGSTWVTSAQSYCDPEGLVPFGPVRDYYVEALAIEDISVPAGQFVALKKTGLVILACSDEVHRVAAGIWIPSSGVTSSNIEDLNVFHWLVEDIGIVRNELTGIISSSISLESWSMPTVRHESMTWGMLKSRYRR